MTDKFTHNLRTAPLADLHVKASDSGIIEGLASPYGGDPDAYGDVILSGAFSASLTRHKAAGTMPVMLWSHRLEQPIGKWIDLRDGRDGLHAKGQINLNTSAGREAYEHVRAGDAGGLSIGYTTPEGGRKYVGDGVFELSEIDLKEVSVVTIPANQRARISGVKTIGSKAEAIDMLRDCGLSRKAAARFAAGGWNALHGGETDAKAQTLLRHMDRAIEQLRNYT
jgi:HK97 family phage prohead protease